MEPTTADPYRGTGNGRPAGTRHRRRPSGATVAFVAWLLVGSVVLLLVARGLWFSGDEWDFLVERSATDLGDLLRPYNDHWVTLPILEFRALYAMVGVRTYLPYVATLIAVHLVVVVLLRTVMRRSGVAPWTATAVAATFVLFGPGNGDILWAFQIGFTGAVALGLTHLVLADHDDRLDRRDLLGILAGIGALMCSGVGLVMAAGVGLAVLLRRGWRAALVHTVPLAVVYVAWRLSTDFTENQLPMPTVSTVLDRLRAATWATALAFGHHGVVAAAILALLAIGLVLRARDLGWSDFRRSTAMPLALLAAGVLFTALNSLNRWIYGAEQAASNRYLYVLAACMLPALGVAADALMTRWRVAGWATIALVAAGVPWNMGAIEDWDQPDQYYADRRAVVVAWAESDLARHVPADHHPTPATWDGEEITVGWLLDALDHGKLPAAGPPPDAEAQWIPLLLGVRQLAGDDAAGDDCIRTHEEISLHTVEGDVLSFDSDLTLAVRDGPYPASFPWRYAVADGNRLEILAGPLDLFAAPAEPGAAVTLCSTHPGVVVPTPTAP